MVTWRSCCWSVYLSFSNLIFDVALLHVFQFVILSSMHGEWLAHFSTIFQTLQIHLRWQFFKAFVLPDSLDKTGVAFLYIATFRVRWTTKNVGWIFLAYKTFTSINIRSLFWLDFSFRRWKLFSALHVPFNIYIILC